jgi:hypothetical protein
MVLNVKAGRKRRTASADTNPDPVARVVEALERGGFEPKPAGKHKWESRCPAHEGERHNLSIARGDDGRALLHCNAHDCPVEAIVQALGLTLADLFPAQGQPYAGTRSSNSKDPPGYPTLDEAIEATARHLGRKLKKDPGPLTGRWDYHDADSNHVATVIRYDPPGEKKQIRPISRDVATGRWKLSDPPGLWPLYRLPELDGAARIYLPEGEKCADLVVNLGLVATTTAHGAKSPRKTDLAPLAGREVVLLPDHDQEGEDYVQRVLDLLADLERRPMVKVVRLPVPCAGDDIEQWLAEGVPDGWGPEQCRAETERLAAEAEVEDLDAARDEAEEEDVDGWPPLRLHEPPSPLPFPIEVFPEALQQYCREVASTTRSPIDFAGCAMVAVGGAAIGQSVNLQLSHTWMEAPLLYMILVARSGRTKSPVIRIVRQPLRTIDRRLREESKEALASWTEKKKAHKEDPENNPPPGPEPPRLRAVVDDVTRASLVIVMDENPRGVLADPKEATAWINGFNEFNSGEGRDRQFWLNNYDCEPVQSDRKGGRESIDVPFPFCAVLASITPAMLSSLKEKREREDGFIERIAFTFPDTAAFPPQHWTDAELSEKSERIWLNVVTKLHEAEMVWNTETKRYRPWFVDLTETAKAEWIRWFDAHADEMTAPDFSEAHDGAWAKMKGRAGRFALIIARFRWACSPATTPDMVGVADVQGAVKLVDYFKSQLLRVYHEMTGGVGSRHAKTVLDWIRRKRLVAFREADVRDDLHHFRGHARDLTEALKVLEDVGVIRPRAEKRDPSRRGPKPSPAYNVHPDILTARSEGN